MEDSGKLLDENCSTCGGQMNTWDMRLTKKFKVRNTCEKCFCDIYDMKADAFRKTMEDYFGIRPCQGI